MGSGALAVSSSIIAGNSGFFDISDSGIFTDGGGNFIGNSLVTFGPCSITGITNPGLAPLGNYGGPTETMALLPGSRALGNGLASLAGLTDQRGYTRTDGIVDAGAYQSRGFTYTITGGDNQTATLGTAFGPMTVRVIANDLLLTDLTGGTITLAVPGTGATATGVLTQSVVNTGGVNQAVFSLTAAGNIGTYQVGVTNSATPLAFTLTNSSIFLTVVAAPGQGKIFGQADPSSFAFTFTDSSGTPITITYNGTLLRRLGEDVNFYLYDISQLNALNTNYVFTLRNPGSSGFTITPVLLTVTATSASGVGGQPFPTFGGTVTGFQFGENDSVITGLTYISSATTSSPAGIYAITPVGATARNYTFLYNPASFTLTARPSLPDTTPDTTLPTLDTSAFDATRGRNNRDEREYLYGNGQGNSFTISCQSKSKAPASILHISSSDVVLSSSANPSSPTAP